ncbi:MAG: hypothetical protein IJP38_07165 [Oscillospiraceae bacterium]|nr:hypothetical protein [Oscillospiraceae bacterium]
MSTCQILNITQSGEYININFVSQQDLAGGKIQLYDFDFKAGDYGADPMIEPGIGSSASSPLKYRIPGSHKLKCIISKDGEILAEKEAFVGNKHKITIRSEKIELGRLYKVTSEISVSKDLIYYNAGGAGTKITLPRDLYAGDTLLFVIKEKSFIPQFKLEEKVAQCFTIEY